MQRKHRTQMSASEITSVESLVHSVKGWRIGSCLVHASKRGRTITRDEVLDALTTGEVIEVNDAERVLMRSAKGICVVVNVKAKFTFTVWVNDPSDNHKTLNRSEYQWRVNVANYLRGTK